MALLTPDEYVDLLDRRSKEHQAELQEQRKAEGLPPVYDWARPMLARMIRDGDEYLVDMDALTARTHLMEHPPTAPKQSAKPRVYRSAASLIEERDKLQARLDRVCRWRLHDTDDMAAYGGIGIRQTPRQRRQADASHDRALEQAVTLTKRVSKLDGRISSAQQREANTAAAAQGSP